MIVGKILDYNEMCKLRIYLIWKIKMLPSKSGQKFLTFTVALFFFRLTI